MAISNRDIQTQLIKNIARAVGDQIWNYNQGTPEAVPAVHREKDFQNSTPPSPQYPFISVDILNTVSPYQRELSEGWLDDGRYVIQETRVLQYSVRVHGDGNIDINQIANELRLRLKATRYIADMQSIGAGYYKVTNIIKTSQRLTDQYMETSQFNISYSVTDFTELDEADGAYKITQVEVDTENNKDENGQGGLYEAPDDPDPIQIDTGLIS